MLLGSIQSFAQKPVKLSTNEYQFIFTGASADTISTALHDSVFLLQVDINKTRAVYSNHQTKLSKVGSTAVVTYYLLGKNFSTDVNYDTLTAVIFKGTVSDTLINSKFFVNKGSYNYFQYKAVLTSGRCKIAQIKAYLRE